MKIKHLKEAINQDKTIDFYRDKLDKRNPREASPEQVIEHLLSSLSSQQQKFPYVRWVLDRYLSKDIKRMEDFSRVAVALAEHKRKRNLISPEYSDINRLSFEQLQTAVEQAGDTKREQKTQYKQEVNKDIEIVYNGPEGRILIPKTEEASCFLGKGTRWCTASTKGENYFSEYNKYGPLYVIMPNDSRKYQFHLSSAQLMNEKDEEINFADFDEKYPWVFDNITFSEHTQLSAVRAEGYAIQFIRNPTEKVKLAAVKGNGYAIQFIKNPTEEQQLAAVKENGKAIKFIKNPTEKVQLAAVRQNGKAIKFIKNPTEKVQLAAVRQNGDAIRYIKTPSKQVQLAVSEQE